MGKIKNVPSIVNDQMVNVRRSDIGQRAEWFYFMNDEAAKKGINWEEYARPAIYRVGCFRGGESVAEFKDKGDLQEFAQSWIDNDLGMKTFEKEIIKNEKDEVIIEFHFCPLVAAWQKHTDDEALIAKMCDVAMDGDRGVFSNLKDTEFHLEKTIAEGCDVCRLRLTKTK